MAAVVCAIFEIMEEELVLKLACFTSENRQTGRVIEVALFNGDIIPGDPIVTITTDENIQRLSLNDIPGLLNSIQLLLDFVKVKNI